jgi:hypothetical protein
MEFNEMKSIWNCQKEQPISAFNADALHRQVKNKATRVEKGMTFNELGMIGITLSTAFTLAREPLFEQSDYHKLFGAVVMIGVGVWMYIQRKRRLARRAHFEANMLGDLDRAMSEAEDHLRLARTFQWWFMLPALVIMLVNLTLREEPPTTGKLLILVGGFALATAVVRFSIYGYHLPTKRNLESLRDSLSNESR